MKYLLAIFMLLVTLYKGISFKTECGISKGRIRVNNCSLSSQHIVGGADAGPIAWPWQMYLEGFSGRCGAILIHPKYALTAAHCTIGNRQSDLDIFGRFNNLSDLGNVWHTKIKAIYQNPKYNDSNLDGDISILEFIDKAPISDTLYPVCLPDVQDQVYPGEDCYATGWGLNETRGLISEILQEACLPIISHDKCKEILSLRSDITETMLCAGYQDQIVSICQGDSGGPLVCKRGDIWKVLGISIKTFDCELGFPSIFTNLTKYLVWIRSIVHDDL